jgi:hypothetical protein
MNQTEKNGMNLSDIVINVNELTMGEVDEIEERTGLSLQACIGALESTDIPIGKIMRAFALIGMRRTNPTATWEDTADVKIDRSKVIAPLPAPGTVPA